jgi:hypothetical protein
MALAARTLLQRRTTPAALARAAAVPFLDFVLALGILVRAVVDDGLAAALGRLVPDGSGLVALLGTAALAAVLANLVNSLPAVLVLLPLAAHAGPGAVLASCCCMSPVMSRAPRKVRSPGCSAAAARNGIRAAAIPLLVGGNRDEVRLFQVVGGDSFRPADERGRHDGAPPGPSRSALCPNRGH